MKVTDFTRECLVSRKHTKKMRDAGYICIESDWRFNRGGLTDDKYQIEDVKISLDGKKIWYKPNQEVRDYDTKTEQKDVAASNTTNKSDVEE